MPREPFSPQVAERLRQDNFKDSLEVCGEPRHGYIGFMQPLCISDDSQAEKTHFHSKEELVGPHNVLVSNLKAGKSPDVYFSHPEPLCNGDPFSDSIRDTYRHDPKNVSAQFRSPGFGVHHGISKGITYVDQKTGYEDPKAIALFHKGRQSVRGIFTQPSKSGKYLTQPSFIADDYDNPRKLRRLEKEKEDMLMKGLPPFRGNSHGNRTFHGIQSTFGGAFSAPARPDDFRSKVPGAATHTSPFIPSNPSKKGTLGSISKYPEYFKGQDNKLPGFRPRIPRQPGMSDWRYNHLMDYANPTPSVALNTRNLRSERPISFMRPSMASYSK